MTNLDRPTTPIKLWNDGTPDFNPAFNQSEPTLTPYWSDASDSVVIICPGGAYVGRAPYEGGPIAEMFQSNGISAMVLAYRVSPYTYPVPQNDAKRAIRLIRANAAKWGVRNVAIMGFSAGGHLAAMTGTVYDAGDPNAADRVERESSKPDAMLLCYPVISGVDYPHRFSFMKLTGEDKPSRETLEKLSPELLVDDDTPPAFLWHTAEDEGVPCENSLMFAMAMTKHRRPVAVYVTPKGGHGLGLAQDEPLGSKWGGIAVDWLRDLGF